MNSILKIIAFYFSLFLISLGQLTFDKKTISETLSLGQTKINIKFYFKNKSNKTVEVSKLQAPCDCLNSFVTGVYLKQKKTVFKAGESGVITGEFDLKGLKGLQEKKIKVWTDSKGVFIRCLNKRSLTLIIKQ